MLNVTVKKKNREGISVEGLALEWHLCLIVLQRGPRYFDPPDSGWGACYNCGEEGHISVNCTLAKRKKPCFVCGSLEHHARQCTKVCGWKKLTGRFLFISLTV